MALSRDNVVSPHEFSLFQSTTKTETKAESEERLFNEVNARLENAQNYINRSMLLNEKFIEDELKYIPEEQKIEVKKTFMLTVKIAAILNIEVKKNKNIDLKYDEINHSFVDKDNNRCHHNYFYSSPIPKYSFGELLCCSIKGYKASRDTLLTMLHSLMLYCLSPDVVTHDSELNNLPKTLNCFNIHRLIMVSFLSAYKYHHGEVNNSEAAKLFRLSVQELTAMELIFLREIKCNLSVDRKVHNFYALKLNELDLMIPEDQTELMPDLEQTRYDINSIIPEEDGFSNSCCDSCCNSSPISTSSCMEQLSSNTETLLTTTQSHATTSKKRKDAPVLDEDKHIDKKATIDTNNQNQANINHFFNAPHKIQDEEKINVVNIIQSSVNINNFFNTANMNLPAEISAIIRGNEENINMLNSQNPPDIIHFFHSPHKIKPADVSETIKSLEGNSNLSMDIVWEQLSSSLPALSGQ